MDSDIRKSVIAGSWYPNIPDVLKKDIDNYIDKATVPVLEKKPACIISPHAGYMFSGPVAGHAYKTLIGHKYSTVVVISPSHRMFFPFISLWTKGGFETPLGIVNIDEGLCAKLILKNELIKDERSPHAAEHALEIQLPFLQRVLGDFNLCPVMVGDQSADKCRALALALKESIENPEDVLIVASTDLSHFHSEAKANKLDSEVINLIDDFNIEGLANALDNGTAEACGGGPVMAAMMYCSLCSKMNIDILKYASSADITGDSSSVVGYMAAVIY